MQRILVMGSSGSGKSTFARRLCDATGLPFVSLDALFWKPGWQESERSEFDAKAIAAANPPRGVMDGNSTNRTGDLRRERADAIFWFDLPRRTCMTGILFRIASSYGHV